MTVRPLCRCGLSRRDLRELRRGCTQLELRRAHALSNLFHGGYEHHLGAIDLRGGALYTRKRWQPTGGIGLNLGDRMSLDLATYGTSASVERTRRAAVAVSLRFNQQP